MRISLKLYHNNHVSILLVIWMMLMMMTQLSAMQEDYVEITKVMKSGVFESLMIESVKEYDYELQKEFDDQSEELEQGIGDQWKIVMRAVRNYDKFRFEDNTNYRYYYLIPPVVMVLFILILIIARSTEIYRIIRNTLINIDVYSPPRFRMVQPSHTSCNITFLSSMMLLVVLCSLFVVRDQINAYELSTMNPVPTVHIFKRVFEDIDEEFTTAERNLDFGLAGFFAYPSIGSKNDTRKRVEDAVNRVHDIFSLIKLSSESTTKTIDKNCNFRTPRFGDILKELNNALGNYTFNINVDLNNTEEMFDDFERELKINETMWKTLLGFQQQWYQQFQPSYSIFLKAKLFEKNIARWANNKRIGELSFASSVLQTATLLALFLSYRCHTFVVRRFLLSIILVLIGLVLIQTSFSLAPLLKKAHSMSLMCRIAKDPEDNILKNEFVVRKEYPEVGEDATLYSLSEIYQSCNISKSFFEATNSSKFISDYLHLQHERARNSIEDYNTFQFKVEGDFQTFVENNKNRLEELRFFPDTEINELKCTSDESKIYLKKLYRDMMNIHRYPHFLNLIKLQLIDPLNSVLIPMNVLKKTGPSCKNMRNQMAYVKEKICSYVPPLVTSWMFATRCIIVITACFAFLVLYAVIGMEPDDEKTEWYLDEDWCYRWWCEEEKLQVEKITIANLPNSDDEENEELELKIKRDRRKVEVEIPAKEER